MAKKNHPYHMGRWMLPPVLVLLLTAGIAFVFLKLSDYASCPGVLEPLDKRALFAPSSGLIDQCCLVEGEQSAEGELLLTLDCREIDRALERARHSLTSREHQLSDLKEGYQKECALADFIKENNRRCREVNRRLYEENNMTAYDYNQFLFQIEKEKKEWDNRILSLETNRNALEDQIEEARLQVENLLQQRGEKILLAPAAGQIILTDTVYRDPESVNFFSLRPASGLYVEKGALLAYLVGEGPLCAKVIIPERKIGRVSPGGEVRITLTALPESQFRPLKGELVSLSPSARNGELLGIVTLDRKELTDRLDRPDKYIGTSLNARIPLGRTTLAQKLGLVTGGEKHAACAGQVSQETAGLSPGRRFFPRQ